MRIIWTLFLVGFFLITEASQGSTQFYFKKMPLAVSCTDALRKTNLDRSNELVMAWESAHLDFSKGRETFGDQVDWEPYKGKKVAVGYRTTEGKKYEVEQVVLGIEMCALPFSTALLELQQNTHLNGRFVETGSFVVVSHEFAYIYRGYTTEDHEQIGSGARDAAFNEFLKKFREIEPETTEVEEIAILHTHPGKNVPLSTNDFWIPKYFDSHGLKSKFRSIYAISETGSIIFRSSVISEVEFNRLPNETKSQINQIGHVFREN